MDSKLLTNKYLTALEWSGQWQTHKICNTLKVTYRKETGSRYTSVTALDSNCVRQNRMKMFGKEQKRMKMIGKEQKRMKMVGKEQKRMKMVGKDVLHNGLQLNFFVC
jgi:hypothetical protein